MKRILTSIVTLLIFFSCSIVCYAADNKETSTGNVYGKFNYYSNPNIYTATSNNGQYMVTTDDGIQITVYSSNSDLVLVVHQIEKNEKESFQWFESCVPQSVIRFVPYDIFFLDTCGEQIGLSSENEITISLSKSIQGVLGLSYNGTIADIPCSISDGKITFTATDTCNYYLLCEKVENMKLPKTSDTSKVLIWIFNLMLTISWVYLASLIIVQNKKSIIK